MPAIPASVEELTPAWFEEVLAGAGYSGASVTGVANDIISAGVGFVGIVVRSSLTCSASPGNAPSELIVKLPSPDPGSRMVGVAFGLFEREVRFYADIAATCGMPTPGCLFTAYDPAAGNSVIVLEALNDGRFGDQLAGSSVADAEAAIDAIAAMHAAWWESPRLGEHAWITSGIENLKQPIMMMYEAAWRPAMERLGHLFPAELRDSAPDLGRRAIRALDGFLGREETLCHGDYRSDNLFFPANRPGAVIACDWQSPGRGPAFSDVAYFIGGSLDTATRRATERDLLHRYHEGLRAGGISTYSFDQLLADYRLYFSLVFAGTMVLGGTLPDGNERGRTLIEQIVSRYVAVMQDQDSLALLPE
jgi:hypothetical protein